MVLWVLTEYEQLISFSFVKDASSVLYLLSYHHFELDIKCTVGLDVKRQASEFNIEEKWSI